MRKSAQFTFRSGEGLHKDSQLFQRARERDLLQRTAGCELVWAVASVSPAETWPALELQEPVPALPPPKQEMTNFFNSGGRGRRDRELQDASGDQ